jgi:hypothetical protein
MGSVPPGWAGTRAYTPRLRPRCRPSAGHWRGSARSVAHGPHPAAKSLFWAVSSPIPPPVWSSRVFLAGYPLFMGIFGQNGGREDRCEHPFHDCSPKLETAESIRSGGGRSGLLRGKGAGLGLPGYDATPATMVRRIANRPCGPTRSPAVLRIPPGPSWRSPPTIPTPSAARSCCRVQECIA